MRTVTTLLVVGLLSLSSTARAELYMELALQGGGDSLVLTNDGNSLNAGGGLKLALGVQNPIDEEAGTAWRLALGYLGDSLDGYNGWAEIDTLTFDALYLVNSGKHRFGIGPTLHLAPEYSDRVAGYRPLNIEFDDALGFTVQYGYSPVAGFELGLRLTQIEYRNSAGILDAGSLGVFLSNGF